MQTGGVLFKPGLTGLTASKPAYPGLIMSVWRAVGTVQLVVTYQSDH